MRLPYREALAVLEDEQAGERVWRTVPTAHTMALWRIEDMNRTPVVPTRPGFIVSPDGETVAHTFTLPELHDAPPNRSAHGYYNRIAGEVRTAIEEIKNGHTVSYEAAEERARAKVEREDNVDAILARHLEAYIASQGRIANTSACELINTDIPVDRICVREAANNPYVKRLYHAMTYLHRCWAHKNAISARDMLSLMRRYLRTDGGGVHV
jgi:hypothetical protein